MSKNENDFINKLAELIGSNKFGKFAESVENLFSGNDLPPADEEEIYSQLVRDYVRLLKKLKITKFSSFCFADYSDLHIVVVDGKRFDFDSLFLHDDSVAAEYLCEIDALVSDLNNDENVIFKEIEKRMNARKE